MQRNRVIDIEALDPNRSGRTLEGQPVDETATLTIPVRLAGVINKCVFFGLLVLVAASAVPYGTVQMWWKMAFVGSVLALTALWLIEGSLSGAWFVRSHRLLLPLFGLVVYALIQTFSLPLVEDRFGGSISADRFETLLWSFQFLALTLVAMLLMRYTNNPGRFRALVYVVIGVGLASALFGIARQTMQGTNMGFILPRLVPTVGYGQFINRNHFAFLMEMAFGLLLGLLVARAVRRDRILVHLAMLAPIWAALVLSNSRGGILSMLCQVIFVVVLLGGRRRTNTNPKFDDDGAGRHRRFIGWLPVRIVLVLFLVALVAAGTVWVGGDPMLSRLESERTPVGVSSAQDFSRVNRSDIWRATWGLIKAHPIAGSGFGGYWTAITAYHHASGDMRPEQAHNDYLEILASGGVIGAALFLWFLIAFLKSSLKSLASRDSFRRAACYGALIGLFGVAIHSFVDFGLHIIANALVFTALVVVATTASRGGKLAKLVP